MASKDDHIKIIEDLADNHELRVIAALNSLESSLADLVINAPDEDGNLSDPNWAISSRADIEQQFRAGFLSEVDAIVREYDQAVQSLASVYSSIGVEFVVADEIVSSLKRVAYQGFEDIASTFVNELSNELYQNTLAGRSKAESVKSVRQKINGVYMQSDKDEINRLVDIANEGGERGEAAVQQLHREYATDRTGRNMKRYAGQMVNDSLTQFDASINMAAAKEADVKRWEYYGDTIRDTRQWCRDHVGKVYTEEEIRELWANNSWQGKASGDPFIVRGGYNCRHQWLPASEIDD